MYQNTARGRTKLVSDLMSSCVAECTEDTPVDKVYELIQQCDHGFVVVIDSESHRVPLGVASEHSICEQIVVKGRSLRGLTAGIALDSRIRKVPDTTVAEDISKFLEGKEVAAVVVVNNKGGLSGIVPTKALASLSSSGRNDSTAPLGGASGRPAEAPEFPGLRWAH